MLFPKRKILAKNNHVKSQSIRVLTSNVRGIIKNWESIQNLNLNSHDIIMLNEIWQIRDFENLQLENFTLANSYTRSTSRGGGSLIFVRDNIEFEKIVSPKIEGLIETCAINISGAYFVSLYRPPSGNKNEFIDSIIVS